MGLSFAIAAESNKIFLTGISFPTLLLVSEIEIVLPMSAKTLAVKLSLLSKFEQI